MSKQIIFERGYQIRQAGPAGVGNPTGLGNGSLAIDGITQQSLRIGGETVYLQNTGDQFIYFDIKTGVDNTKFQIAPGQTVGPYTAPDALFFKGEAATNLKYIFVEEF